ncbi:uncharacterized protein [Ptychodera flava]|uniref:uncharacterized protein n=1 Tax=Ptychodera flava TaxID=63121 RepID=UPI00396AA702
MLDFQQLVAVQFKHWSTDLAWQPEDGQLEIFKKENGVQILPEGLPDVVPMTFQEKDISSLKQSIAKSKDVLRFAQFEWWKTFLDSPKMETVRMSKQSTNWYLGELSSYRPVQPPVASTSQETTEAIDRLLTREREGRQVTNAIRRQRRVQPNRRLLTTPPRSRRAVRVAIAVGNMAIFSFNEDKAVGKVMSRTNGVVSLQVYRNVGNGVYQPMTRANGDAHVHSTQIGCVLHSFRRLTQSNRLPGDAARIFETLRQ